MYNAKTISKNLDKASLRLGHELVYHSVPATRQAVEHLDKVVRDGTLQRPLTPDEHQWIANERTLCALDFEYYRSHYFHIKRSPGNEIVLFQPNIAQRIMSDVYAEMEGRNVSCQVQYNKARQLGVTTDTICRIAHRVQFRSNVYAIEASSRPEKSAEMVEKIELAWSRMPWWLMPRQTAYSAGKYIEFGTQGSAIRIEHGAKLTGMGRGSTPSIAHLSEVSEFEHPAEDIDASLIRAMHVSPEMFLVLESTSKGVNNWWHEQWKLNKDGWPKGIARMRPIFLPWFIAQDLYPTETWLREHPLPPDWQPSDLVKNHALRCEAYARTSDLLRKYYSSGWKMPLEQQWYYEIEREEYRKKHELNKFLEEMPADDLEAFQVSGISVFDVDTLADYRERCRQPLGVYGFRARSDIIPERLQPARREIDPEKPRIAIQSRWAATHAPIDVELVPLKFHGYGTAEDDDGRNRLFIWRWPKDGEKFGVSADSSEGIGLDQSVIQVLSQQVPMLAPSEQCAEFASQYVNPIDLWPLLLALGTLYSTKIDGLYQQAKMTIEVRSESDSTLLELRKRGWRNFAAWIPDVAGKNIQPGKSRKLGWYTNVWSRRRIMSYLIKNIRDFAVDINSPWLINEFKTFQQDDDTQKLQAEYGAHDDRVMAFAFGWYALHWLDIPEERLPVQPQVEAVGSFRSEGHLIRPTDPSERLSESDWQRLTQALQLS